MSDSTDREDSRPSERPETTSSAELTAKSRALIAQAKHQVKQSAKVSDYSSKLLSDMHNERKK